MTIKDDSKEIVLVPVWVCALSWGEMATAYHQSQDGIMALRVIIVNVVLCDKAQ